MTITDTGSFTITATDSAGGLGTGTEVGVSNAFTVDPGPLDHFVVEAVGGGAIGTQIAGVAFNVQITAEDANNNTMTFFDGAGNTVKSPQQEPCQLGREQRRRLLVVFLLPIA